MLKIMLLVATVGLIDLKLRLATSVTHAKTSDSYDFPLSLCLRALFWFMFYLVLQITGCVAQEQIPVLQDLND